MRSLPLDRKVLLGFAIAALMVLVVGAFSYLTTVRFVGSAREALLNAELVTPLKRVLAFTYETEAAQRSFLYTGEESNLVQRNAAIESTRRTLDELRRLARNDPALLARIDRLVPIVEAEFQQCFQFTGTVHPFGKGLQANRVSDHGETAQKHLVGLVQVDAADERAVDLDVVDPDIVQSAQLCNPMSHVFDADPTAKRLEQGAQQAKRLEVLEYTMFGYLDPQAHGTVANLVQPARQPMQQQRIAHRLCRQIDANIVGTTQQTIERHVDHHLVETSQLAKPCQPWHELTRVQPGRLHVEAQACDALIVH